MDPLHAAVTSILNSKQSERSVDEFYEAHSFETLHRIRLSLFELFKRLRNTALSLRHHKIVVRHRLG